jgi:hypothetical protein
MHARDERVQQTPTLASGASLLVPYGGVTGDQEQRAVQKKAIAGAANCVCV